MRRNLIWIALICLCLVLLPADAQELVSPAEVCPTSGTPEPFTVSTCTNCAPCDTDDDCGTGTCVSIFQTFLTCEEECSIPETVCSLSCDPCTSNAQCPGSESCVDVRRVFCTPEEECGLPDFICEC